MDYVDHISVCPTCSGKGYTDKTDHDRYLHNVGLAPHQSSNGIKAVKTAQGLTSLDMKEIKYLRILEQEGQKQFDFAMDRIVNPPFGDVRGMDTNVYEGKIRKFFGDFSKLDPRLQKAIQFSIMQQRDNNETYGDPNVSRRRSVKVTMSDGDVIHSDINGTVKEVEDYYLKNRFVKSDEKTFHHGVKVEFLK